jgi:hypothetical protein
VKRDSLLHQKFHVIIDTVSLFGLIPINVLFALGLAFKVLAAGEITEEGVKLACKDLICALVRSPIIEINLE